MIILLKDPQMVQTLDGPGEENDVAKHPKAFINTFAEGHGICWILDCNEQIIPLCQMPAWKQPCGVEDDLSKLRVECCFKIS